jgi:hypothetical protein
MNFNTTIHDSSRYSWIITSSSFCLPFLFWYALQNFIYLRIFKSLLCLFIIIDTLCSQIEQWTLLNMSKVVFLTVEHLKFSISSIKIVMTKSFKEV